MIKNIVTILSSAALILTATSSFALSVNNPANFNAENVSVGDSVVFLQGFQGEYSDRKYSKGGGEFNVYKSNNQGGYDFLYQSFCLERNEYLGFGQSYTVTSLSDNAYRGGKNVQGHSGNDPDGILNVHDPISKYTEYLYHNFYNGTLTDYTYDGFGDNQDSRDLQFAFWYFEDELQDGEKLWGANGPQWMATFNPFITMAINFVDNNPGWQGFDDVKVMNIVSGDGTYMQSQLIVSPAPVPEPATMLLFGIGLMGLGVVARRRAGSERE